MKFFRAYIFPAFYGLMVYFTIRLLHDVGVGERFWERDWALNFFEMACSVLTGYLSIYLFKRIFRFYDQHGQQQFSYQRLKKEVFTFVLANLIVVNLIFIPMASFSGDGLSWADVVSINIIPTLFALIYYGMARSSTWFKAYVDNRIQLEKVTNEHLETELKFLKAQYHPHFLFNALNTIYFQMDEDLNGAKRSIEKFSELLRYQLYNQQQKVPVIQEIEYLQSFIELQKIRSTDKLKLEVNFDKQLNDQLVFPLLFLPLVENAFKYIGGAYKMKICAVLDQDYITFSVENSVLFVAGNETKTGGIGLSNLKRRLDLLYSGKHILLLENDTHQFKAVLQIQYESKD